MKKSFGAWLYGAQDEFLQEIKDYNDAVRPERQVRYLYPHIGKMYFPSPAEPKVPAPIFHAERLNFYVQYCQNHPSLELQVHPMIDGSIKDAGKNSPKPVYVEQLAESLAEKLRPFLGKIHGLHLDIEPVLPGHEYMYQIFKKRVAEYCNLPLSIAVGRRQNLSSVCSLVDMAVLMLYDCGEHGEPTPLAPEIYAKRARARLAHFREYTDQAGCYTSVGLPAAVTGHEYEGEVGSPPSRRMDDYLRSIWHDVLSFLETPKSTGITLWNIRNKKEFPKKEINGKKGTLLFPATIEKAVCNFIQTH